MGVRPPNPSIDVQCVIKVDCDCGISADGWNRIGTEKGNGSGVVVGVDVEVVLVGNMCTLVALLCGD